MAQLNYETAMAQRRAAIKRNRAVFVRQLDELAQEHRGEYALLRNGEVIRLFANAADALQAALFMFPDDVGYSVEKIEPEPIEMGMYADVVVDAKR